MNRNHLLIGACAMLAVAAYAFLRPSATGDAMQPPSASKSAIVEIQTPPLDGNAVIGQRIFQSACSTCHGPNGVGVEGSGPPLIHVIYEPGHHADEAFQRAVALGVRSHHWRFGDMPPVDGLTRADVAMVIAYIRALQRANGIN